MIEQFYLIHKWDQAFYSNQKIHTTKNSTSIALYFRQEVVYSQYQENNPTVTNGNVIFPQSKFNVYCLFYLF